MKIGILGSGVVAQTLGTGLMAQGHDVKLGTRDPAKLAEWSKANSRASVGSFADAAKFGEAIFIATLGVGTENAVNTAGRENFRGKIVVDVTNPLDFSEMPPKMFVQYPESLSLRIQKLIPDAKMVKAFNTVPAHIMTNPGQLGEADLFVAGHDEAKQFLRSIAQRWGWHDVIDIGDMKATYWVEAMGMAVITYGIKYNDWNYALKFLRK